MKKVLLAMLLVVSTNSYAYNDQQATYPTQRYDNRPAEVQTQVTTNNTNNQFNSTYQSNLQNTQQQLRDQKQFYNNLNRSN